MIYQLSDDGDYIEAEEKYNEVWKLWEDCFADSKEYMDFYFKWKAKDNKIHVLERDGKVVSMVQLNPYDLQVGQKRIRSYYIVGVATNEEYRKQGLMRTLLNSSLNQMYQEKIPFTYLMPASEAIYEPFDFVTILEQKRISIPMNQLERYMDYTSDDMVKAASIDSNQQDWLQESYQNQNVSFVSTEIEEGDTQILSYIVEANCTNELIEIASFANLELSKEYDIYTDRDIYYYQRMIAELYTSDGALVVVRNDGKIIGYGAYVIEDNKLEVLELVTTSNYGKMVLEALVELVSMKRENERKYDITEPSIAPKMMVRIVNVMEFAKLLRASEPVRIVMRIHDDKISDNDGVFELYVDCENGNLRAFDVDEQSYYSVEIETDIVRLTSFFFGVEPIKEFSVQTTGVLETEVLNRLNKLKMYERVYLNEVV